MDTRLDDKKKKQVVEDFKQRVRESDIRAVDDGEQQEQGSRRQ